MQLISANYYRYTRFHLNPLLTKFSVTPTSPITVVAGDNGAGKSSFLATMFPTVLKKEDLGSGGYVKRVWEHLGKIYIDSISELGYSFLCDGEQLNPSGGIRMQETLYLEHFGVDNELAGVLTWQARFTSMSTQQRQYWITRLSNNSLDAFEKAWRAAKDTIKEADTIVKYTQTQLDKYAIALNYDELVSQKKVIEDKIQILMGVQVYNQGEIDDPTMSLTQLHDVNKRIRDNVKTTFMYRDRDTHQLAIDTQINIGIVKKTLSSTMEALLRIPDNEVVDMSGIPSREECIAKLESLPIDEGIIPIENAATIHLYVLKYSNVLYSLIHDIGSSVYVTEAMYIDQREQVAMQESRLAELRVDAGTVIERRRAIEEQLSHKVTCPACQHTFSEAVTPADLAAVIVSEQIILSKGVATKNHLTASKEVLQDMSNHLTAYRKLMEILCLPELQFISSIKAAYPDTGKMTLLLGQALFDLDNAILMDNRMSEREIYHQYLNIHTLHTNQQVNRHSHERSQLETIHSTLQVELLGLEKLQVSLTHINQAKVENSQLYNERRELYRVLANIPMHLYNQGIYQAINQSLLDHRSTLAKLQQQITQYLSQAETQAQLQGEIAHHKEQHRLAKLSEQLLNPRTGFIGFMYKKIVEEHVAFLNTVLAALWSYNLTVAMPSGNMTYRFPLTVDGLVRGDISEGSKGMQEAVDMAFILMVRVYSNVNHLPLLLDEFGSTLDGVHLQTAYAYLHRVTTSPMYLVSHLPEIMTLFDDSEAEFILLKGSNMDTTLFPPSLNKNLIIGG